MRTHRQGIIVVLGAPNDRRGRLSPVAASRCGAAIEEYGRLPRPILPTGGWGSHFNTTARPHHEYVTKCLLAHHVWPAHVLPGVDSGNTYEDVEMVAVAAARLGVRALTVVTSDFHVPRVQLLFTRLAPDLDPAIVGAHADLAADERAALEAHEREAIVRIGTRPSG